MASPSITSVTTTNSGSGFDSNSTTHNVSMPATVAAGDLLICIICFNDEATSVTTPSGWELQETLVRGSADLTLGIYRKDAVGDEDGTTVDFATGTTCGATAMVLRVLAAEWNGTLSTGVYSGTAGTSTTASPDPPSVTPAPGSQDYRFVAIECGVFDRSVTGWPTSYADNQTQANSGVITHLAVSSRALTGTTDDPGAYTTDSAEISIYQTLAIAPTAATAAVTGTAGDGCNESDIVSGGQTVIVTLTGATWDANSIVTPVVEAADCTVSGNNTAEDPWAVSHPNASTGDLLIFYIAWDDSTATTDVAEPAGPNSEVLTEMNATPVTDSSTETRAKAWYTVATGSWTAGTLSFNPDASESWSATCIRVPAGEFDSSTPIGAIGTSAATTTTDTTVDSPAFTAGASDGDGLLVWCAGVDTDPLSGTNPTGWTIRQSQDLGAVAHGVATRDTEVTDSESISSATWSIAGDSWTSIAFVIRAPTTTPFEDARQSIIDGMDSAQSEGTGWDAVVKAGLATSAVARTSDTVVTVTLSAFGSYAITANETITVTVPAGAQSSGGAITASPTFVVTNETGGAVVKDMIQSGFIPFAR